MDRSKTSRNVQGVAKEAVFKEKQSMIQLVRVEFRFLKSVLFASVTPFLFAKVEPSPFHYLQAERALSLYFLSMTEAAIDCHFVSPLITESRAIANHMINSICEGTFDLKIDYLFSCYVELNQDCLSNEYIFCNSGSTTPYGILPLHTGVNLKCLN
uniref:Uncharacterized protein n=1 Tax=Romanomermis culicivorax TaxID=13658 RepID=A0A915K3A7_ROMCU